MAATVPFGMMHMEKALTNPAVARFKGASATHGRDLQFCDRRLFPYDRPFPLLRGRPFAAAENLPESKSHVAILDKLAADKLWPGGNAVGKHIRLDEAGRWANRDL